LGRFVEERFCIKRCLILLHVNLIFGELTIEQHFERIVCFKIKKTMKASLYMSLLGLVAVTNTSFKKAVTANVKNPTRNTYMVLIEKSKYEFRIYDSTGEWLITYPVVFGNKDQGDKLMAGDRKTPEGTFHTIDYPTQESYQKFNDRKAKGIIPADAKIGGDIGIHGTWPHEDYAIDQYQNWTEGCISTKNMYIQEIFNLLPVGTRVEIRK
jgi:murein L,D-transpeptidase YafK